MDIFMDKLAQRVNAQEMIKANSEADTARMEELQTQVDRYEAGLQDMQNCQCKECGTVCRDEDRVKCNAGKNGGYHGENGWLCGKDG